MKRIIAISDTHLKEWKIPEKLEELMEKADYVVHAGDFNRYNVYKEFAKRYDLRAVCGNTDDEKIKKELPEALKFEVEDVKFGVVHKGNYLNDFSDLGYRAMELGVDFLIFGHIHRFFLEKLGKVVVLCPGSPTEPRLSAASCAEIIVDGSKVDVQYHIVQNIACGCGVIR